MNKDTIILQELAKHLSEVANLPVQQEKKKLWTANNDLKPIRPMVNIDQFPWHEINKSDEMTLHCNDVFLRDIENTIKQTLYRWKHFPCDMVVENRIDIPKIVKGLCYGTKITEHTISTDIENDIVAHEYMDTLQDYEQLNVIPFDKITVDTKQDNINMEICQEIFKGIIQVRHSGIQIHAGAWDWITQMRSITNILWDIIDRPEFVLDTAKKYVAILDNVIDQCEQLDLLDDKLSYVHCTGAYTNDIEKAPDGEKVKAKNVWSFTMAQLFSTVSPQMHNEFDIEIIKPMCERFGLMYYGCCEPLENKIEYIKTIKNVRKISVSPWANIELSAQNMGKDYVMSLKSNPAFIANGFDEANIKNQITLALNASKKTGTPLEIILKDISTVGNRIDYIDRWNDMVMNMVENA